MAGRLGAGRSRAKHKVEEEGAMFEILPYQGSGSLQRLRRDMDDIWSRFFDSPTSLKTGGEGSFMPLVNLKETDQSIEVTAEVPGLKPEEIEISLAGDLLTLKGEKKEEKEEKKGGYHLVERRFGSFSRSFRLPVEVDRKKVEAKYKDGVLHLTLPKGAKESSTKIKVKAE